MTSLDAIVAELLTAAPALELDGASALLDIIERDQRAYARDIDVAILHAARVDRLGYAFVAGYAAATKTLGKLLGEAGARLPRGARISIAATEESGAHPRAIKTTLTRADDESSRLDGQKVWSTLALEGTHLLVIARAGERDGRPLLKAVLVPSDRTGVTLTPMPLTPFCPEVRHATIRLDAVVVQGVEVFERDGFSDVLKPFRTIEDICVHASLLAWVAGMGRRLGFERPLIARAVALLVAVRELSALPPDSKATHVALGGLLGASADLMVALEPQWAASPVEHQERFARDRPLLGIASRAREERLSVAWQAFERSI